MKRHPWLPAAIYLLTLGVVGMTLAVTFDALSSAKDDLWWSFSRAGVGIAFATVAAAAATGAFRIVDQRRARDEERRKLFSLAEQAYNDVKAVRRRMLALGLRERRTKSFTSEEWQELRDAIAKLNVAQLTFEALGKQIENSKLFAREEGIVNALREVENYLNSKVLQTWEEHGWNAWKKTDTSLAEAVDLSDFTRTDLFKGNASERLEALSALLQEELFGKPKLKPGKSVSVTK